MTTLQSLAEPSTCEWPLWEPFWSAQALAKRRQEIGPRTFDRGFRQMAYVEGERTFPSFMKCVEFGVAARQIVAGEGWKFYVGVDLSSKGRPGTVAAVLAVNGENLRVPADLCILADPAQLPAALIALHSVWKPEAIKVENNATQDAIVDMLRAATRQANCNLPIQSFTTGANKAHPEFGLPSLEVEFNAGLWRIPLEYAGEEEIPKDVCWRRFLDEFKGHPFAPTSDVVMAFWFAREAARGPKGLWFHGVMEWQREKAAAEAGKNGGGQDSIA